MVFKGTLGATNGSVTSLPTNSYQAGWTYRVADAGPYAGDYCEVGDLIIAINDGPASGSTVINADWAKIEHNIDGAVYMGHAGSDIGSINQPVYVDSSGLVQVGNGNTIPFIVGNSGTTVGTWEGTLTGLTAYYDGLLILFKPVVAGASTTTLSLNNLDAKTIYLNNTSKLTTHYPANQPILLVYSESQNSGCWEALDSYDSGNTNTQIRIYKESIDAERPLLASRTAFGDITSGSGGHLGLIPSTIDNTPTINTSTGKITIPGGISGDLSGNASTASKVNNDLVIKLKSGTTEGTDLYTFNGSAGKTLDIKQGTGITLTAAAGSLTIANAGVTGVKGNSESSYRTGEVNITKTHIGLGNVTNHQQVHEVDWDSTNKKITRSKNETAGDVVTFASNTGISLTANASSLTIGHSNSVTAKTSYGSTATTASANGGKITVTDITYDAQGHVTGSTDREITLSQTTYTVGNKALKVASDTGTATQAITVNESSSDRTLTIKGDGTYLTGSVSGSSNAATITIEHASSGVTAGTTSPNEAQTPGFNATFNIPTVTFDAAGHITSTGTTTVKIPAQTQLSKTDSGSGNAVTAISVSNHAITVTKGDTFVNLSSPQTISGTKTFSAIQQFTSTADSAHSTDDTAAVSISGGLSVAKQVSAKQVKIDNGSTTKGVQMIYDDTLEVLNFIFS